MNCGEFPGIVWSNVDGLLNSVASVVIPFSDSVLTKMLAQTIGVGAIEGVYRLARDRARGPRIRDLRPALRAMLVVWHYPPTPRFLFPLFPLLLAGFSYQLAQTWRSFVRRMPIHGKGARNYIRGRADSGGSACRANKLVVPVRDCAADASWLIGGSGLIIWQPRAEFARNSRTKPGSWRA